jgi:phosphoribosylanthranilate isomerase
LHAAKTCGLDAVQLHGDETQADIRSLRAKGLVVIKALRVKTASDLVRARSIEADAILLDTAVPGIQGGTGKRFDWTLLKYFKTKIPVIVSGGLSKKNIQELLGQYTPYGVDVSSGVERSPGIKDVKKIREFVRRARSSPK